MVFSLDPAEAPAALDRWIGWARRCRIEAFVQLQRRIVKHRATILAAIEHGLSNGRIESVNTKIRLLTRIAFGFNSPDALIALAMLTSAATHPSFPAEHDPRISQESPKNVRPTRECIGGFGPESVSGPMSKEPGSPARGGPLL